MRYLKYSILFFLFSVVFTSSTGLASLLFCAAISLAAAKITLLVFPRASESAKQGNISFRVFFKRCLKAFLFCLVLLKSIYTGAFITLVRFIRSKAAVRTVLCPLTLKTTGNAAKLCIWQAVTLTPGTLSADANGQNMQVLCFEGDDAEQGVRQFDLLLQNPNDGLGTVQNSTKIQQG